MACGCMFMKLAAWLGRLFPPFSEEETVGHIATEHPGSGMDSPAVIAGYRVIWKPMVFLSKNGKG